MPLIHVHLAEGPTAEAKLALMKALTEAACTALGVSVQSVRVWITPIAEEEFMAAGVSLAERRATDRTAAAEVAS
jgi:4-oxalocrotonate tautomerase